jgi:hypothetical protein
VKESKELIRADVGYSRRDEDRSTPPTPSRSSVAVRRESTGPAVRFSCDDEVFDYGDDEYDVEPVQRSVSPLPHHGGSGRQGGYER